MIEIEIDRTGHAGRVDLVGTAERSLSKPEAQALLDSRSPHPGLAPRPDNIVNLSNPGTSLNAPSTFGQIRTAGAMREIQLGARLTF